MLRKKETQQPQQERKLIQRPRQHQNSTTYYDVRMVAFLDPESSMFMHVAQNAYKEHMDNLIPCTVCGRKFFPERIQRHESTCAANPIKISGDKLSQSAAKGSGQSKGPPGKQIQQNVLPNPKNQKNIVIPNGYGGPKTSLSKKK